MSFQADIENLSPSSYLPTLSPDRVESATYGVPTSAFEPLEPDSVATLFRVVSTLQHAKYLSEQMLASSGILRRLPCDPQHPDSPDTQQRIRERILEKTTKIDKTGRPYIVVCDANQNEHEIEIDYEQLARFERFGPRPSFTTRANVEQAPVKSERVVKPIKQASTFAICVGAIKMAIVERREAWNWAMNRMPRFGRTRPVGSIALSR